MKRKYEESHSNSDDSVPVVEENEELSPETKLDELGTEKLLQLYGATLSPEDRQIFEILKTRVVDPMPLFGPKASEAPTPSASSNPLYAHSVKANSILAGTIDDVKAYHTALLYDSSKPGTTSAFYDMSFILPLLCHVLDEKNVCDGVKVIANGWIYFIVRGMGLEDETLRAEAFLCFQRLIDNFERAKTKTARNKDAKLYLHFLSGFKRGIVQLGECRISHLLATWLVGVWEVLKQPSHSMFKRVTTALFAKPTVEMTIIPDFIPFYNDGDESRESRTWILNILYHGLKTREDWRIAQKSPTIKFLCSSFLLEKVKTQRTIIAVLMHGAKIPEVAEEMTDKHSLPLWVSNLNVNSSRLKSEIEVYFRTMEANCPKDNFRSKIFDFVKRKKGWLEILPDEVMDEKKDEIDDEMEVGE